MASGPTVVREASSLSLLGCRARTGGAKEISTTFCSSASLPARAGCPTVMFTAFQLPLLGSAAMGREKGPAFSQKDPTSAPLTIQATVWGLQTNFSPILHLLGPSCPCGHCLCLPPILLPCLCQYAHLQLYQWVKPSGVLVSWAGGPLLSYCGLSCKFKRRKKGDVSLHVLLASCLDIVRMAILPKLACNQNHKAITWNFWVCLWGEAGEIVREIWKTDQYRKFPSRQ